MGDISGGNANKMQDFEVMASSFRKLLQDQEEYASNMNSIIENLDSSQLKVEKNAFDAINSSDTALNLVKEGMACVDELTRKINVLNSAVESASNTLKQMESLTLKIVGFANVITGISTKTNMLSLNASIEAARAGEHGRGFAVVASEVRSLAEQSAKSSREITDTIQAVSDFSKGMVGEMGKITNVVGEENVVAKSVEDVFKKILDASYVSNDVARNMENEIAYQRDITDSAKNGIKTIDHITDKAKKIMSKY